MKKTFTNPTFLIIAGVALLILVGGLIRYTGAAEELMGKTASTGDAVTITVMKTEEGDTLRVFKLAEEGAFDKPAKPAIIMPSGKTMLFNKDTLAQGAIVVDALTNVKSFEPAYPDLK